MVSTFSAIRHRINACAPDKKAGAGMGVVGFISGKTLMEFIVVMCSVIGVLK